MPVSLHPCRAVAVKRQKSDVYLSNKRMKQIEWITSFHPTSFHLEMKASGEGNVLGPVIAAAKLMRQDNKTD